MSSPPRDGFRRTIDYLRVSITDRCNFRCIYCMPKEGIQPLPHEGILTYEEIVRVVQGAISRGITRVRITGGEPLVRRDAVKLIAAVRRLPGLQDISLTTNGSLLAARAADLAAAGLSRVNISLDSLSGDRFARLTRNGSVDAVLEGIEAAYVAGLGPIKINMVPIRGVNDDEIGAFAKLVLDRPYHVRFIEFMPMEGVSAQWRPEQVVHSQECLRIIEETLGPLEPEDEKSGPGPARYFRIRGAKGKIGVISPVSNHFCHSCNRLRLTADGKLKPCLFSEDEIDVMAALRFGMGKVEDVLDEAIRRKPERHRLVASARPMSRIGG